MPTDEQGDEYMTYEEFAAKPVVIPANPDPEDVARAVRYMEEWLPIGARSVGSATVHSIQILMNHARSTAEASDG
jgi:2-keto-3-deoxy-L-rhamnonate aldolase RhmA